MAYCKKCGAYIPDGQETCLACGYSEAAEKAKEKAFEILSSSRSTIMSSYPASPVLEDISNLFDSFLKPFKGEK